MATLSAIRQAIADVVGAAVPTLTVYAKVSDATNLPAMVVVPAETSFIGAMGRGLDTHTLKLYVLASYREAGLAQDDLDELVAGSGAKSVRQAIWDTRGLGLAGTDATVTGMSQYGTQFATAGVEHVGAILTAIVTSPGTA